MNGFPFLFFTISSVYCIPALQSGDGSFKALRAKV